MKTLACLLLILLTLSCKKTESDPVNPEHDTVLAEYPDWYTIKAPVDKEIVGVWGDRDKTLLISTSYALYRSTDMGLTWQEVLPRQSIGIFGVVQNQDTLFTMTTLVGYRALASANAYSVDDGQIWQAYQGQNRIFDIPSSLAAAPFPVNPVVASNGVSYQINQVFLDGPTATTGLFETPGVVTSDGRRINLPQLHQLQSLYLDAQQRLYIAGTDAICGRGHSGESFSFCNSKQGRGVVYISKKPRP